MKKHAKKLLALAMAFAICLGVMGTATAATGKTAATLTYKNINVTLDGKEVALKDVNGNSTEPFIMGNSTYVPVRAVSEALGLDVDWNASTNTVALKSGSAKIQKVVANCTSEPYGKTIRSFTFYVNSTQSLMNLTVKDFKTLNCIYDGMEFHEKFSAQATNIAFTGNSMTVEVEPFYPDYSVTREGYWELDCTNDAFDVNPGTEMTYVDPVVDAFEENELTYGDATIDYYLFTPEGKAKNMPIVVFNSGGSGISVTNDPYGATFAVSFAKDEIQKYFPCYVLYPQRNAGSTENLIDGIKSIVDGLIAEGKVDANRVYISGESAGSLFTMNFVSRHPGYCAAIVVFDGGGDIGSSAPGGNGEGDSIANYTLEEAAKKAMGAPFSDADMKKLAESGSKIMLVQSLGDTTSVPMKYAATYQKLVNLGMKPGVDVIWHYYTAEKFNALLGDRTNWLPMNDAEYVVDPVTGVKTYTYPEGKLHNGSYPGGNDDYIKMWLMDQSKGAYSVEFNNGYSASWIEKNEGSDVDYSIIPERYTRMAVLNDVPLVPAGSKGTATVYTDDAGEYWYISFHTFFNPDTQYVEAIALGGRGYVVMDSSGTWWTNDITYSTMPYLLSLDNIDWQPYSR